MAKSDWERVKAAVPLGSEVSGRVVAVQPFGVFVDLGLGFVGLLEVPEFGGPIRPRSLEEYPPVGVSVTARVLQHADRNQQLLLTQRPLTGADWERVRAWAADPNAEPLSWAPELRENPPADSSSRRTS